MAWFTRFSRFGDVHLVYGQEAGMSCGIASTMMCVFKINKLKPGKTALTVEEKIYAEYAVASGGTYTKATAEVAGTYGTHLATILSKYTKRTWNWHQTPVNDVVQTLMDKVGVTSRPGPTVDVKPVILGVDWDLGGAHWVVVDTVRTAFGATYATICDPWDTNVHIQKITTGGPFYYDAATGGFAMNFGGKHKGMAEPYKGNAAKGQVKTWGMICPD